MVRRRLLESERSFCSGLSFFSSTPARSASIWRAPRLSVFSMSSTKVKTSPERSQPKQYQDCIWGLTLKLGLSSWWKGQRPQRSLLRLVRRTCSWTTLTRSTLALTSAKASSDAGVGTRLLSAVLSTVDEGLRADVLVQPECVVGVVCPLKADQLFVLVVSVNLPNRAEVRFHLVIGVSARNGERFQRGHRAPAPCDV